ncbi:2-succinyl-6-hydroxy-2,4-cyclohexadiene-1-carboxylate synthase [Edwardsiella piscicida]|uniref:2-succinyl-6-hydroxy-2,4-cyclohexadiene-1-carboxylate synthase n=3 Tax=Edwardsiella TaxID=635 RepID=A0A0H3DS72_EDWTF|nr:2-succinyl-6-hydroxy-2,4-cyclohexadiene-1-carboxylate synthase [Edwardsiella piscicida]ACY85192.1 acyl-CoA thioester hydrolase [Edwardsiella tarda EIB202]ADM42235.1 acyl-CoA thioester hydrolase [Edwardsiella tarda FL6-60]AGH74347.1 acyl-CoA thioester hydrolase [Edwardsiella piscicida C07-087]AOP43555.1 2-succinyl-6-hydroxy-2,4-cyclohexadiene-1-carboxylate synthase [Edwardsiella piscicida]ARD19389.1 2-succinyl-6-hydroxy-2,4-cyclohexadiene-1-carboxylate synthase [Edwardsiella piscicida]
MILAYRRLAAASPAAPTLVWLHGFLGSHREWLALAQALPQYAHVLIDLPGHGESAALTVDDFAQCDAALRDTLRAAGVTSYGLIGYSLGGRLAMYHGCQGAPGLWALAVEGGNPGLETAAERQARRAHDGRWAERLRREPLAQVLDDWYRQPVFADLNAASRAALVALRAGQSGATLAQMLQATSLGAQPPLGAALAALTSPLCYLCGERDAKFRALAERWRLAVRLIDGAGHNAHRANPRAFLDALGTFLMTSTPG